MNRNVDCPKYLECLSTHAYKNREMDCPNCKGKIPLLPTTQEEYRKAEAVPEVFILSKEEADVISKWAKILGRLGGLKGGPARASRLSPERRVEIARNAARARWGSEEVSK